MKMITRLVCLVLCVASLGTCMVACSSDDSAAGAYINMYLSSEVYNFDPAYAHLDSSASKVLALMYEGLMKMDDDGDVVKSLCEDWKYIHDTGTDELDPSDDTYKMEIVIKTSAWSDGRALSADDFVYAWKRLLEPEFDGEGAELLYDIKGARDRKTLAYSPDDIGLYPDKNFLTIEFERDIDPQEFLRKLTSISLVPLREDAVDHYDDWSSASTTIQTNGPYTLRTYIPGNQLVLERNIYYLHDITDDEEPKPDKHVKPYRIVVDYTLNAEEIMEKYDEGELFYLGEIPASKEVREKYAKKVKYLDSYSTAMYYFNTTRAPFNDARVRQALSLAIDRAAIADELVFAKAAEGMIPSSVKESGKTAFSANRGDEKLAATANLEEARRLLSEAGIDPASFGELKLTVRGACHSYVSNDAADILNTDEDITHATVDVIAAKMVIDQWNALGFNFKLDLVNAELYNEATSQLVQYTDKIVDTLYGADTVTFEGTLIHTDAKSFDVIALDYQLLDTTAFAGLSVYANKFSGCQIDFEHAIATQEYKGFGHVTGFDNETYNALIEEAYTLYCEGKTEEMNAKLHEAEKLLLSEMPVVPVFEYQNAVLIRSDIRGEKISAWGYMTFTKAKLSNWRDHLPEEENEKK